MYVSLCVYLPVRPSFCVCVYTLIFNISISIDKKPIFAWHEVKQAGQPVRTKFNLHQTDVRFNITTAQHLILPICIKVK